VKSKTEKIITIFAFAALLSAIYWFADPLPDPVTVTLTPGPSLPRIPPEDGAIDSQSGNSR